MLHFRLPQQGTESPLSTKMYLADSDETLIALWLHGRGLHTRRAYEADASAFLATIGKPLRAATLGDMQAFADSLTGTAPASQARRLSVAKSLISFGHRVGYLPFNIGAPVRAPKQKEVLAERILAESDVHRLLTLEQDPDHVFLRLLVWTGTLADQRRVGVCQRKQMVLDTVGARLEMTVGASFR